LGLNIPVPEFCTVHFLTESLPYFYTQHRVIIIAVLTVGHELNSAA